MALRVVRPRREGCSTRRFKGESATDELAIFLEALDKADQSERAAFLAQACFAAAAESMRRILVENARRKQRVKRGRDVARADLDPDQIAAPEPPDELLAVDEALDRLAQVDPSAASLVKLRYFAGLSIP
jgi:hypothetical protein